MNGDYEKLIDWCKMILGDVIRSCGLEEDFKNRLYELTWDWKRRKEKAETEGREIGGLKVIFMGLLKSTEQAIGLAKRYNRDVCHYLRMSLRNKWLTLIQNAKTADITQ